MTGTPEMDELPISEETLRMTRETFLVHRPEGRYLTLDERLANAVRTFLRAEGFEAERLEKVNDPQVAVGGEHVLVRLVSSWKPEQGTDSPSSSSGMDSGDAGSTP